MSPPPEPHRSLLSPPAIARFVREVLRAGRVERRTDLDRDRLESALERVASGQGALRTLKHDLKASVYSGLPLGGREACLKVYPSARRGRRCFRNLCSLWARGVAVPEPYFFWERPRAAGGGAAVGMEDLSALRELDRWLAARLADPVAGGGHRDALGPVFRSLGAVLRDLHAQGIYLDDLKTCNIFFDGRSDRPFRFVDVDGAWEGRPVNLRRRAQNLTQLNRSVPIAAGLSSRRVFWREYRRDLPSSEARKLRRLVLDGSSAESGVLYVSDSGIQEEPWPRNPRAWPR